MKLKVFVVFHKALDERLALAQFTQAEIEQFFVAYGVNEEHADKVVTRLDGRKFINMSEGPPNLLLEHQLRWYDPNLQQRGFMETSCYVHLVENDIQASLDYVGVAQYDMRWTPEAADLLRRLAAEREGRNTVFGLSCGDIMNAQGEFHPYAFAHLRNWDFLLESYNRFFGQNWDLSVLINKPFSLWQTHLMPREEFADMAAWLCILCEEVYPWANQPPYQTHWGVLGGYTDLAESLFVAARLAEEKITFQELPLEHDEGIVEALGISKEHYGGRPGA